MVEKVKKAAKNPRKALQWMNKKRQPQIIARDLNRIYHKKILGKSEFHDDGIDVLEKDWDNLIILDACRYDTFEDIISPRLPGVLKKEQSRGAATTEFLRANFSDRDLTDTIYITANGQYSRLKDELGSSFYHVVDLTQDSETFVDLGGMGYVPPEKVQETVIYLHSKYPNKRLLTHFLQPHYPFIHDEAEYSHRRPSNIYPSSQPNFFGEIFLNSISISKERIIEDYEQNLESVSESILELNKNIDGKTVVTADHGEALGDKSSPIPVREWGHPSGVYIDALVNVPWFICEWDSRREILSESPIKSYEPNEEIVSERLQSLGYAPE